MDAGTDTVCNEVEMDQSTVVNGKMANVKELELSARKTSITVTQVSSKITFLMAMGH